MITDLAQGEIDRLTGLGIQLTPDEIVTLNAYAVDAMRDADAQARINAERVVRFGVVVFREPTLAHYDFINGCLKFINTDNAESDIAFRAFVCTRSAAELPDYHNIEAVTAAVHAFTPCIAHLTPRMVQAAVEYVFFGEGVLESLRPEKENELSFYDQARDWVIESAVNGVVYGGISFVDAMKMRPSVLKAIMRSCAIKGVKPKSDFGDFYAFVTKMEAKSNG